MTAHGGARRGAGRKPGRPNGETILRTQILREACRRAGNMAPGMTPLDVIEYIMREALSAGDPDRALSAAGMALPFRHAR